MEKNFIITQEELTMKYGFGIDLGGTTVKIAYFDETGKMLENGKFPPIRRKTASGYCRISRRLSGPF